MLSRNLYKLKKAPLGEKRKKLIISSILAISIFFIIYGLYSFNKIKPANGEKVEIKLETGDRPLKKNETVYIKADGGLSLRKERDKSSEKLAVIPNNTKLEATEELDGWYKVNYEGKEGWIAKKFTTLEAPAEDVYKDWSLYTGTGYKIKYPLGWKVKNYGQTGENVSSLVAFSNSDLPETIPANAEFIAPIFVKVTTKTLEEVKKDYASISGVKVEELKIGSVAATKYTYTSEFSNTEMTGVVIGAGSKTIVLDESGGYGEDLANMIKTMIIGG